jgi:hypothetical protein
MVSKRFQDLDVYRLAEKLSEEIWNIVQEWKPLPQDTKCLSKLHWQNRKLICCLSSVICPLSLVFRTNDE